MVISSQDPTKNATKDLESLRHTLLNGTACIAQSLKVIELRLAYMSNALKLFEETLKDCSHEDNKNHSREISGLKKNNVFREIKEG